MPVRVTSTNFNSYAQTAKAYNGCLDEYQDYLKTRTRPERLKLIEDTLHNCAEGFEAYRDEAPAGIDVDDLIAKCNNTIFAVHGTRTTGP